MKKEKGKRGKGLTRLTCASIILISHFSFLTLFSSCRDVPVVEVERQRGDTLKENIINANRYISQGEEVQIDAYIQRRGWEMQRLLCGARVMVTTDSKQKNIDFEDVVAIEYDVESIGGQKVYSHVQDTVVAGRLQPTRGLDAALRTLRPGQQAVVILPSEQAYGVVGDGDRIGSRMILVYKINKIKRINNNTSQQQ